MTCVRSDLTHSVLYVARNHKGERLFTRSLAIAFGVRGCVARGVFLSMRRFNDYDFSRSNISEIFSKGGK
jgi:hypothetical protein